MRKLMLRMASVALLGASFMANADWVERGFDHFENLGNDTITLTYGDLGAHEYVKLNWDLFIIDTWDGYEDGSSNATDFWGFGVDGNEYVWSFQASANVSRDNNPDRTGVRYYGDVSSLPVTAYRTIPMVMYYENYNDGWIIPHTGESLTITFFARGLQSLHDESWAISDVFIATGNSEIALNEIGNLQDVSTPGNPLVMAGLLFPILYLIRKTKK
ncbi:hypothetical protein BM524_19345 (plasmid) [Alteromonas mediterranea]|uniref:PEP-CTERM sorting domain-containing protein n=1 Tax=Alteromonas mediterranea TaxID=314275 RepID=A0AAC9JE76_9ALTE|nr:hypothetical protein [Alteromonas mediterranea]APD92078.1 hypothetical protein BM524_19345 [Alteromonas mediterranea]